MENKTIYAMFLVNVFALVAMFFIGYYLGGT